MSDMWGESTVGEWNKHQFTKLKEFAMSHFVFLYCATEAITVHDNHKL